MFFLFKGNDWKVKGTAVKSYRIKRIHQKPLKIDITKDIRKRDN